MFELDRGDEIEVPVSDPRVWRVAVIERISSDNREILWELRKGEGFGRSKIADVGITWRRKAVG